VGGVMSTDMKLAENLHVNENGSVFIGDDRSIIISISAFGKLRKELIENIGTERMKGFLIRYGWELGQEDAEKVLKKELDSVEEMILYGPVLHKMQGNAMVEPSKLEVKTLNPKIAKHSIHMEGIWRNSYEAEEHIRQFSLADSPICYTLVGYGSGFLSKVCNQKVIFKEVSCEAKGDAECSWIAKSLDYWNDEVDDELQYYKNTPIVKELEMTYEKLLEERDNLEISTIIHKKLTAELLQGSNLESIANVVYETTDTPGIISDINHEILASKGLSSTELYDVNEEFKKRLMRKQKTTNNDNEDVYRIIFETETIKLDNHSRMVTPIFLKGKVVGYSSFIYFEERMINAKIDTMILERIASVSSLYLLNEKTKFGANQRMKEHFFNEILEGESQDEKEIVRRGNLFHLDLSEVFRVVVVNYEIELNNIKSNKFACHEKILEETSEYFESKKESILIGYRANNIILLVPKRYVQKDGIDDYCNQFMKALTYNFSNVRFLAGISKESEDIGKAKDCYNEALIALRMASVNHRVISFDSLGIIGPLINQNNEKEVKQIAQHILGPLLGKLDYKKQDLLNTLYVYLSNGGNLEQTAAQIALSLSGLRYRLAKIEEMLGRDLRDSFNNHQLLLALQALVLIGEIELNTIG
jgi:PucR family transcriptional regulator, purine catabolism regulatory protein